MDRTMLEQLQNADVYSTSGDKIGSVGQVYLDDHTEEPTFITVKTGLFGTKETFVPLDKAQTAEGGISVPFEKDFVKDAPNVDADGTLTPEEERRIYEYYSMDYEGGHGDVNADGHDDVRAENDGLRDDRTAGAAGAAGA
ncbi:PRC-barrel domain-containing protein, partial [Micrococcus sp. HMSC067E09]